MNRVQIAFSHTLFARFSVREVPEIVSVSTKHVISNLHTHLCMRNLCARWIPLLLTIDQKRIRVTTSEQNFAYDDPPLYSGFT